MASLLGDLSAAFRTGRQSRATQASNKAPVPYIGRAFDRRPVLGRPGTAAQQVRQQRAAEISAAVFSIVSRTSTAAAVVPWHLHYKTRFPSSVCAYDGCDARGVRWVPRHPVLTLLDQPNPFYTRHALFEAGQQHVDLTGEGWIVLDRQGTVPAEMWVVRPDRMTIVTSRREFLVGYMYHDPDGMEIPIRREDVIRQWMPHPLDPYRGLGPVQSVMSQVEGGAMSAEYNVNFYANGARPGGVVTLRSKMDDKDFDDLVARWEDSHGGIHNAGRTAFLEDGQYTAISPLSARDMQYVEAANLNRDTIMLAYGASKFDLGILEDVNRAASEAAAADFAGRMTVPRLDRWKGMLNQQLLPQFGEALSRDYELVYSNPVPRDRDADREDKQSAVTIYTTLVGTGVDPVEAAAYADMPVLTITRPPIRAEAEIEQDPVNRLAIEAENRMKYQAKAHVDGNTCQPCKDIDGKLYRNLEDVRKDFDPEGGYRDCIGAQFGNRCRCTYIRRRGGND